jgi:mono/diheme cytochrome c family protein
MKNVVRAFIAAVIASTIPPTAAPQASEAAKTFREGVFTPEQANRGEQVYASKCAMCHGDNLAGMEAAPPMAGPAFKKAWESQPLVKLANLIQTTMPPGAANSLSTGQLTDLIAYALKANDIRAGSVALNLPITTPAPTASFPEGKGEWTTYGADLASTRYSPRSRPVRPAERRRARIVLLGERGWLR